MASPDGQLQRTNVMAIACLVVAVLSLLTCGGLVIGPLVGLVLGALALVQISASNGRETGSALAATGLALNVASFLLMVVAAAILFPILAQSRDAALRASSVSTPEPTTAENPEQIAQDACAAHVKQIALAALMYTQDYDERLPREAAPWTDLFEPYVKDASVFQCPSDDALPSYEFHPKLRGQTLGSRTDPADDIMLFETDDQRTVAWRHQDGAQFAFLDGHVKWLSQANNPMSATRP